MSFRQLFRAVDIAPLALFRIFFGLLLFLETVGAIFTGWITTNLVEPQFTFSHIGFEWLQPLPGDGMYYYYALMGLLGLSVMAGYRYRLSLGLFTILWTAAYLMQKESYNNHYYLLILVCVIMWFLPAASFASADAKRNPNIRSERMPQWCALVMILQVAIVYFFAVVSKLYPGWLDGTFIRLMLEGSEYYYKAEALFSQHAFHLFLAYAGIIFDLLVVPLLLWKRTRTFAFVASLIFHLFNAIFLQIGIFPFFALSFAVFFYPAASIRKWFFRKEPEWTDPMEEIYDSKSILIYFFAPYFALQLALPLRHFFIPGDVLWTEEGHRLSWRMMLRQRTGSVRYTVVDRETGQREQYDLGSRLTPKQMGFVQTKPDGIWQMAQRIKSEYKRAGKQVSVYVAASCAVNDDEQRTFVDPAADLAVEPWNYFGHSPWILLYPAD
jgi:vitamin K-dependent gamma-carboxylase